MEFTPSTELVVAPSGVAKPAKRRSGVRAIGAAAIAVGLTATFAVPAYAESNSEDDAFLYYLRTAPTQGIITEVAEVSLPQVGESVALAEVEKPAEPEAKAEETTEANNRSNNTQANSQQAAPAAPAIPAGEGSQGLLNAAFAQLGISQDCTDMVQNALAALGKTQRRDAGGYDHGVYDFVRYGTQVSPAEAQPGDIMIRPGHVGIYAGNGGGVHGGYLGSTVYDKPGYVSNPSTYSIIIRVN